MRRVLILVSIAVCSCTSQSDSEVGPPAEEDQYESSGSVFFIPRDELDVVVQSAIDGDDVQLQRLIDFYMFSQQPNDRGAEKQLQRWQSLGAERGLKGARYNLIYMASQEAGPDCRDVRAHMTLLDEQSNDALSGHNSYVRSCLKQ